MTNTSYFSHLYHHFEQFHLQKKQTEEQLACQINNRIKMIQKICRFMEDFNIPLKSFSYEHFKIRKKENGHYVIKYKRKTVAIIGSLYKNNESSFIYDGNIGFVTRIPDAFYETLFRFYKKNIPYSPQTPINSRYFCPTCGQISECYRDKQNNQ